MVRRRGESDLVVQRSLCEVIMTLDLLLIGLAITLDPLPVSVHILLLGGSERGIRKGIGFVLGWMLTLAGVVVLTLLVTGGKPFSSGSAPSTISLVVRILLGIGLLAFAWRKRTQRGRPVKPPRWMAMLDKVGFAGAMGLGFFVQPWTLVGAGAVTITAANLGSATTVLTLVVFCVLASASYLTMQAYAMLRPEAARTRLGGLNNWLVLHQDQVVIVGSVAVGLWLIGKSAFLLVG
jgi:hypothetical protein